MTRLSVLDLVPVLEGGDLADAYARAADLARHVEALGYHRYWVAEHHGMPGIAGAATSVVLAHIGHATQRIRIGSGGIMLPNHAPLQIAEQFGTLAALFPGRVDLGLGRAPGSDQKVAMALRRNLMGDVDRFPNDVVELQAYFAGDARLVPAEPGRGQEVPLYILGSSLFGAQLAAMLGLPYAFASHFAPDALDQALAVYRERFQHSAQCERPYVIAAMNVFAADTAEEAELIATSTQQSFVRLRTGQPGKLPPPLAGYRESLPAQAQAMLGHVLQYSAIGTHETVRDRMAAFLCQTRADELILSCGAFDHDARKRSYAIAMAAAGELESARAAA